MRIVGQIQVEDVVLTVDIDVPDGEKEVFVTNISARCLVIPKERWPLGFLELGGDTLTVLRDAGLTTIGDVTGMGWQVELPASLAQLEPEVQGALDLLRCTVALTFSPEEKKKTGDDVRVPFPIGAAPSSLKDGPVVTPDSFLADIGLLPELVTCLKVKRGVHRVAELIALGKHKLMFTAGISAGDVVAVENALRTHGMAW